MASLRRNKNFTPDPQAKFLYAIAKQLDLRSIDWQEVANEIGINNGHAARMRYSRLRSQFEGSGSGNRPRSDEKRGNGKSETGRKMSGKKGMKPGLELTVRDPDWDRDSDDGYDQDQGIVKREKAMMGFGNSFGIKSEPSNAGTSAEAPIKGENTGSLNHGSNNMFMPMIPSYFKQEYDFQQQYPNQPQDFQFMFPRTNPPPPFRPFNPYPPTPPQTPPPSHSQAHHHNSITSAHLGPSYSIVPEAPNIQPINAIDPLVLQTPRVAYSSPEYQPHLEDLTVPQKIKAEQTDEAEETMVVDGTGA